MAAPSETASTRHIARITFTAFLLTFITSRVLVILIMARKIPDFFFHMGGTHVHHLNYGIFTLSAVGGVLLFVDVNERQRTFCALLYAFGMALTFDEFGMWLHLGGSYWQRASFDAIIVLLSLFGMIAFAPPLAKMRSHHWATGGITLVIVILFYFLLYKSLALAGKHVSPRLQEIEESGPT